MLELGVRNLSKFVNPLIQTGVIEVNKQGKTFIYSLKDTHSFLHTHNRHNSLEETDYAGHISLPKWDIKIPAEGNMLGSARPQDPQIIVEEITEDLQSALDQFATVQEDLRRA